MKKVRINSRGGFTLMETLLALALVATLVSIFLVVFVPARGMVQKSLAQQDAERLIGVLRSELRTIRNDERTTGKSSENQYRTTFDKGFYWLKKTKNPDTAIIIFSYREDLSKNPDSDGDGTRPSIPAKESVPGETSNLITIACPVDDKVHTKHIRDAVGPVYVVRMTQLEFKRGEWKATDKPGVISGFNSPEDYLEKCSEFEIGGPTLFFKAEFFMLSAPNPALLKNKRWKRLGQPIFSSVMSIGTSA